ncbi:hypothetical protein C0J52_07513 [Blattella germanica]|nr:hypothetical protein C0J52_07513 [Blattella germanica]
MTFPQSSFYASNRKGNYPALLPRFGGDDDTAVGNRFGENDNNGTTVSNPSDSIHDPAVVDRVSTWPKDRQPFWFLNSEHINSQRGQQIPCSNCLNPQQSAQQPLPQSPFANNKS